MAAGLQPQRELIRNKRAHAVPEEHDIGVPPKRPRLREMADEVTDLPERRLAIPVLPAGELDAVGRVLCGIVLAPRADPSPLAEGRRACPGVPEADGRGPRLGRLIPGP